MQIEFADTLTGDVANASYDSNTKRLTINIDAAATTANTIRTAVATDGNFLVDLNTTVDATNDGSGIVGATGVVATTSGGTPEVLSGSDVNPVETKGVFNSLLRLNTAVADLDLIEIQRLAAQLEDDFNRVTFARAELGARQQSLDVLRIRIENEDVEAAKYAVTRIDVDLVEAISNLTAQQASLEASLQLMGRTFQLTLLDFI